MKAPTFSIIIPCYNRETLLGKTLRSLLSQLYNSWECIIVDDGSVDDSVTIASNYAKADERFTVVQREHSPKGANTCRNIGLSHARGEFLIFLDSDDLLSEHCLENRLRTIEGDPGYDYYVSHGITNRFGDKTLIAMPEYAQDPIKHILHNDPPWLVHCCTWRAKSIKEAQLFWDEHLDVHQDLDFHLRALYTQLHYYIDQNLPPDCEWVTHTKPRVGRTAYSFQGFKIQGKFIRKHLYLIPTSHRYLLIHRTKRIMESSLRNLEISKFHRLIKYYNRIGILPYYKMKLLSVMKILLNNNDYLSRMTKSVIYRLILKHDQQKIERQFCIYKWKG